MSRARDHGPCISVEVYDRGIVALQEGLPPEPSREESLVVQRGELELAIDHRLGCDFPAERREALWAVRSRLSRAPLRLLFKYLLRRVFTRSLVRDANDMAGQVIYEYAQVLDGDELRSFFGRASVENPRLPVDSDQLKQ